jgi:hypothetical protein
MSREGFLVFVVVIFHLDQDSSPHVLGNFARIGKPLPGDCLQNVQFVGVNVVPVAFGEAEQEHSKVAEAIRDQRSVAAALPLALPSHPLLDEATAEVGVDKPLPCPVNRLGQARIGDTFASREFGKESGFENPHNASHSEV